jgi:DNA mismatch repair protein MutS
VIEQISFEEEFVPNDAVLDHEENKFLIITGPNMAGKSTYLRQVALIVLMAQIGCFIPAESAKIGLVDRIFTRVGASDDLSQGQSTFMVEMSELANILHNATDRSLIILDEIGRGTSTYDGLSIAWAVVEYLSNSDSISAKSMFATHYHELTELEGKFKGVKNYFITAREMNDDIVFLRKIKRGESNQSYGIQVAKLAGVPDEVIDRSNEILKNLEKNDINNNIRNLTNSMDEDALDQTVSDDKQTADYKKVIEKLKTMDVMQITPLEAMNVLNDLIKDVNEM